MVISHNCRPARFRRWRAWKSLSPSQSNTSVVGTGSLTIIAGPCSVESEAQIMEAARLVKSAGAKALRGGVVKYRSSPYSGWEGIGANSEEALRNGLKLIVKAGKEFDLPTVGEGRDANDVS